MAEIELGIMTLADVDAVHEVEEKSFPIPGPGSPLCARCRKTSAPAMWCSGRTGWPVAYAGVWFVLDEGHITNIAVRPDKRGLGYGEKVTRAMMQLAADSGMSWMTLECRRSNTVAQNLYHKLGFTDVGYRKRYYENSEDALIMICEHLPEAHPENDPFLREE